VPEVRAGFDILKAVGARITGPEVIACPTCGRAKIDVERIAREVEEEIARRKITRPLRVAIMGCAVNGPGEAREADLGIAGGEGEGLLFRGGETVRKVPEAEMVAALIGEIESFQAE